MGPRGFAEEQRRKKQQTNTRASVLRLLMLGLLDSKIEMDLLVKAVGAVPCELSQSPRTRNGAAATRFASPCWRVGPDISDF